MGGFRGVVLAVMFMLISFAGLSAEAAPLVEAAPAAVSIGDQVLHALVPILTSSSVIGLLVMVVWFIGHKVSVAQKWNEERWTGMVHAAIFQVHALGLDTRQPNWLTAAENAFEIQYTKTHGEAPSAADLRDGVLDMARTVGVAALPIAAMAGGALLDGFTRSHANPNG